MRLPLLVLVFALVACGRGKDADDLSADSVLAAFEEAGVSVPEPRDNTENNKDLGAEKMITTEAVSIFEFATEDAAAEFFSKAGDSGDGGHHAGRFVIRFNHSASKGYKPEPSKEAYIAVLDALVAGQPIPAARQYK